MRRRPATANLGAGALLGLGAPFGFLVLRRALSRSTSFKVEVQRHRMAYLYMAFSTPLAFAVFGSVLGRKQEQIRRSHEEIERLREEFAAVVAHDLRNPIQNILLEVDLLLRKAEGEEARVPVAALDRLRRGARRLSEMVADLLDATRIEAARLRVEPQPTSLAEAVSALIERIRPALGPHVVELSAEEGVPVVSVDPLRLDQIVTNLVENAAKYSPGGAPIHVRLGMREGGATLAVQDHGQGIRGEEMPRLFDRFYQTKRARAKKVGLGLGLYITKGLVEAHGGQITVNSQPERGSTFTVWFPAAR